MATFFGSLLTGTGVLLVVGTPVFVMASRRGRKPLATKFFIAAVAIGFFFAVASAGSERLIGSCRAAGNYSCLDAGYTGFLFLVGLIYVIAVAAATYSLIHQ